MKKVLLLSVLVCTISLLNSAYPPIIAGEQPEHLTSERSTPQTHPTINEKEKDIFEDAVEEQPDDFSSFTYDNPTTFTSEQSKTTKALLDYCSNEKVPDHFKALSLIQHLSSSDILVRTAAKLALKEISWNPKYSIKILESIKVQARLAPEIIRIIDEGLQRKLQNPLTRPARTLHSPSSLSSPTPSIAERVYSLYRSQTELAQTKINTLFTDITTFFHSLKNRILPETTTLSSTHNNPGKKTEYDFHKLLPVAIGTFMSITTWNNLSEPHRNLFYCKPSQNNNYIWCFPKTLKK